MKTENKPVFQINIQLFAEDEEEVKNDVLDNQDTTDEEVQNDDVNDNESQDNLEGTPPDEEFDEIVYNKEKVKIPKEERQTYLQKGYNYDKVKTKAEQAEQALLRTAKYNGFDDVDSYLQALEKAEREEELKRYQEAASDPVKLQELIENNPAIVQAKQLLQQNQIAQQKESLKSKRFFSILEPDIDDILKTTRNVDAVTAYNFLVGEKIDELLVKEAEQAKKSAIADIADKAKRSAGNIAGDGGSDDLLDVNSINVDMASGFGNDPKKIAKYVKQNLKRS